MSENKGRFPAGKPEAEETRRHNHAYTQTVIHRLSRAAGHLEAVKKMVEEGHDCSEVLIQLAAVRGTLSSISRVILKEHMEHCVQDAIEHGDQESLDALSRAIDKLLGNAE